MHLMERSGIFVIRCKEEVMRRFLFAFAVFLAGVGAGAQENNRPRAFDAIRSSDSYRQAVLGAYQDYESGLSTHCGKIDINVNTSEAKIYGKIETDADGNIVSAHWKETTEGVACGEKRSYAASVTIENGKTAVLALFPGQSAAGAVLQHDAVQYAAVGAGAGSCPVDVLLTALPNGEPSGPGVPWDEKWTVRACGKKSVVTMHFAPDAKGMTVSVSPKETVAAS
jgi:hypothetical protein